MHLPNRPSGALVETSRSPANTMSSGQAGTDQNNVAFSLIVGAVPGLAALASTTGNLRIERHWQSGYRNEIGIEHTHGMKPVSLLQ